MSDHMKTQTAITRGDAEHLRLEAARVQRTATELDDLRVATAVGRIASGLEVLASTQGEADAWQQSLIRGTVDDLLQTCGVALEQVDPARKAVA